MPHQLGKKLISNLLFEYLNSWDTRTTIHGEGLIERENYSFTVTQAGSSSCFTQPAYVELLPV